MDNVQILFQLYFEIQTEPYKYIEICNIDWSLTVLES